MGINIKEILEGWKNHLIPAEDMKEVIQKVSEERMEICRACPLFSENAKKNGYRTIRTDEHCTKCGCPLKAKTKSLSSKCPLDPPKWDAVATDVERWEIEDKLNMTDEEDDELQAGDPERPEGAE